jgi:hypothetical protein
MRDKRPSALSPSALPPRRQGAQSPSSRDRCMQPGNRRSDANVAETPQMERFREQRGPLTRLPLRPGDATAAHAMRRARAPSPASVGTRASAPGRRETRIARNSRLTGASRIRRSTLRPQADRLPTPNASVSPPERTGRSSLPPSFGRFDLRLPEGNAQRTVGRTLARSSPRGQLQGADGCKPCIDWPARMRRASRSRFRTRRVISVGCWIG